MHHPEIVACTGDPATCRVPHNVWIAESLKQGRDVPVRGLLPRPDLLTPAGYAR